MAGHRLYRDPFEDIETRFTVADAATWIVGEAVPGLSKV